MSLDNSQNSQNDQNSKGTNNSQLFELIQTIQNKLNEEISNDNFNKKSEKKSVDKEPEQVKNTEENNNAPGFDISSIASILQKLNLNNTNANTETQTNTQNNEQPNLNLDMNTIIKMQKVISRMNRKDPRKDLLLSLRPFLRKSRQDKINEYVTILGITDALGILGKKGSD